MTPSRLTASLARGRVGSISPSTFIHVLQLVQRDYVPEQRPYSTVKAKERHNGGDELRIESSRRVLRRACHLPTTGRRYASFFNDFAVEEQELAERRRRPVPEAAKRNPLAYSDEVFHFWTEDDPTVHEEPLEMQGPIRKSTKQRKETHSAAESKTPEPIPIVKPRSWAPLPVESEPQPPPIRRDFPPHVRTAENEVMHIRKPADRRTQMTQLDGHMRYDRHLRRYLDLESGPPRIPNQGAPTNDPNQLTVDPNWYRYGYRLGNTRKVPKPEDKLKYLDDTSQLEPGTRQRLQDVRRILKPVQAPKRFGRPRWSSDPLSTRFFRRRVSAPPTTSGRRRRLVVERSSSPATVSVMAKNRYSSRRVRSDRKSRYFPSSTIFPRISSRSRRKRMQVRPRKSYQQPSHAQGRSTSTRRDPVPAAAPGTFLNSRPLSARFAVLQKRVNSGAIKLFRPKPSSYNVPKRPMAPRPIRGRDDNVPHPPLFPDTPGSSSQPRALDSADFIGLALDSSDCLRILDTVRTISLDDHDQATIASIAEYMANPSITLESCHGMDGAAVPETLWIAKLKKELVDPSQFHLAELIAVIDSTPKTQVYLACVQNISVLVHDFQRLARPSEWLWLARQLVEMIQAVTKAGQRHFEPSLFPVTYSVIGLALARSAYGQSDQDAVRTLHQLSQLVAKLAADTRNRVEDARTRRDQTSSEAGDATATQVSEKQVNAEARLEAYGQSILALSAAHVGDWEEARSHMTLAVSLLLEVSDTYSKRDARLLLEYYDLLANNGRLRDLVDIIFTVGPSVQQLLLLARDTLRRNPVFLRIFYCAIADMERPVDWLERTFGWTSGYDPAQVVYTALSRFTSKTDDALELAERMYTHGIYIPLDASARLCGTLFRLGRHEDAHTLYGITRARNSQASHSFLSAMLNRFADAGLLEQAMQVYNEIVAIYGSHYHDQRVIPTELAEQGRVEECLRALRTIYGPSWADDGKLLEIFSRAHQQANDAKGAERLHQKLLVVQPSVENYNSMIAFYAKHSDTGKTLDVFRSLLESGVSPDIETFERLVRLFADQNDLSNVSLLLDAMSKAGIEANDRISSHVILAHVNSADWLGAARCWRNLPTEMQSSPRVAAAILRAFVMLGTPPNIIFSIFQGVDEPTATHWAFLLLSYCDAGQMEAAANVFETMDRRSRTMTKAPAPDLYTFSILLYGYLRHFRPELARATFDEMLRRHVVPSSVTYASIIQSFINSGDSSMTGLDRIHRFAMSIYDFAGKSDEPTYSDRRKQADAVRDVFAGMVTAAGNAGEIKTAQAYFDVAVPSLKQPKARDIRTIGRLMDAYRKQKDIDNVLKMWRMAFNAALELRGDSSLTMSSLSKKADDETELEAATPSNLLCISLSIVMSALGDAGNYTTLKEVWNEVRMEGFGFSPQNFNDYAVALARSGDVEGAFYVIDKVLVPRDRKMREQRQATIESMLAETGGAADSTNSPDMGSIPGRSGSVGDLTTQSATEPPPPTDASEAPDDTGARYLDYDKELPLPQRMSAALYNSEIAEEGATYDPALFGSAEDFAKEGPPAIASTVTNTRQSLSHKGVRSARDRSLLMEQQEARINTISQPAQGVTDLVGHLLTHLRPEDSSWRPSERLWKTIDTAYRELQHQRKELSEEVTASRLALIQHTRGRDDTLNLSDEKRLDEVDPRRQPREIALTNFNNVLVRDRHGRPMKSTPVVVLWRLNAIYPDVVRGIYKFRKHSAHVNLQRHVAGANKSFERQRSKHRMWIKEERAQLSDASPNGLDKQAEARLERLSSDLKKHRARVRQDTMDRIKIPTALTRDRDRYGMTRNDMPKHDEDSAPQSPSTEFGRQTAKAIASVLKYQKTRSELVEAASTMSHRLRPENDSVLQHGRKRVPARIKVLTPRVNLKRLGVRQSAFEPGSIDQYAGLVRRQAHEEAKGELAIEHRAKEAKERLRQTDYGQLLEDFRARKIKLQEQYRRAERAEAGEERQRASG